MIAHAKDIRVEGHYGILRDIMGQVLAEEIKQLWWYYF